MTSPDRPCCGDGIGKTAQQRHHCINIALIPAQDQVQLALLSFFRGARHRGIHIAHLPVRQFLCKGAAARGQAG